MMQNKNRKASLALATRGLLLSCLACLLVNNNHQQHQLGLAEASYLSIAHQKQSATSITAAASSEQQQQAPSINPFSFNQHVIEGQKLMVTCSISSGENPVNFVWLKDGQPLVPPQLVNRQIEIKQDQEFSALKFKTVRLNHAGNYTCLARNRFGSQAYSAVLVVYGGPRWVKEPPTEPIVATRGQTIVIDCETTGWPKPEQTWHIKTSKQGEFEPLATNGGGRISLAPNGSLVIRNADKLDEANYLCKSSNGIGKELSSSTPLKVTVPAYFEAAAKQQTSIVRKGSHVQLRCDAYGDQPITIEWYKNKHPLAHVSETGGPLAIDARYSIYSNNNPSKNGLISQLYIQQAQRQDNSIYECVTKNPYGRDRLPIELIVQEEPDNIQEIQVGPVNSRSVTLMWNEPYDGRSSITGYMFQYKRIQEATSSSMLMNELEFVDVMQSSVADSQQQQQQQQQQVHLTTPTGAKLASGSSLEGDWQHAQRIMLNMNNSTSSSSSSMGSVRSITIDKLEPSSKYLFRALAINSIGQSKFSQPMEFSTDEEAPEVGPVNIRARAINSTSIHVSWDEIPRSKHPGRIHGYYIGYRVATNNSAAVNFIHKPYIINDLVSPVQSAGGNGGDSSGMASTSGSLSTNQQQHSNGGQLASHSNRLETVIQDLRRDTLYEITVLAFNRRGSGPSSDFVVCRTIEMEAPKPVTLTVSRELNESIYIEWKRDPTDQNPVDYYVLYQEKNSNSAEVRLPGNQTHYRAPSLKCGTRYQFYMIAHNKEGKSAPSEVVSASTSGALPVVPSKTSLIKWINSTCLLINLNSFQDNGCRINFFSVRYRLEKQHHQPQNQDGSSIVDSITGSGNLGSSSSLASSGGMSSTNGVSSSSMAPGGGVATSGSGSGGQQLIGANGLSASHQALTAASQHGGKTVLANGHSVSSAGSQPYASEWIAIRPKGSLKQQRVNEEDRMEYLCDLSPVGEYTIHVAAGNDVGRSEIEYTVLMSFPDDLKNSALKELMEILPNFIAYIPSILVFLLAALSLIIVCLILYTTAMKYYQKFVIMQNQMRATRRAKADEKRRRKLAGGNSSGSSRHSQKLADLWADEYEEGDMMDEDDDEDDEDDDDCGSGPGGHHQGGDRERIVASSEDSVAGLGRGADMDGDDEDEATDELQSNSSSGGGGLRAGRVTGRGQQQQQRLKNAGLELLSAGACAKQGITRSWNTTGRRHRTNQHKQQQLVRPHNMGQQHQQYHHHQYSSSSQQQHAAGHHHYLSNLASSAAAFDSSSIDSPCSSGKRAFGSNSGCMSTASNDSSVHGRFQCLSAKQYVKMNEYSMLPTISASLSNPIGNDIYGTAPVRTTTTAAAATTTQALAQQQQQARHSSPLNGAQFRPINGTSPGANSSASNTTNSNTNTANSSGSNNQRQTASSLYYSTLRRPTNMQTYLPQQQQQQQRIQRRQSQNMADIYDYYMAPPPAQAAQVAYSAAAAQQAANEAANSIFVPPQQIIYSAPNIRRQPSVFV